MRELVEELMVDGIESRQYLLRSTESVPFPLKISTYSSGHSEDKRPDDSDCASSTVSVTTFLASGTSIIHVQLTTMPAVCAGRDTAHIALDVRVVYDAMQSNPLLWS